MADFERFELTAPGADGSPVTRAVFRKGRGPGVLLLHELPGMVPECVELGRWLAERGYAVHLPLMFGEPEARFPLRKVFCLRHEFNLWSANRTSPIVAWLRALADHVAQGYGPRIGAIGMCLTGSFAVALMLDERLRAPVVSQPSLPLFDRGALDLTPAELERAGRLSAEHGIPVLAFRFADDRAPRRRGREVADPTDVPAA